MTNQEFLQHILTERIEMILSDQRQESTDPEEEVIDCCKNIEIKAIRKDKFCFEHNKKCACNFCRTVYGSVCSRYVWAQYVSWIAGICNYNIANYE
ncbi:MAG: hypothetical protein Q4C66_15720 [Lachnospiraceae bacterium]|nr:hypothetical protein [Lachnospiraceae bacterium]